jgi:hypothetical protein
MLRVLFILAIFSPSALPQGAKPLPASTAAPANFLPKDSPHLYRLYFYFHTAIDSMVQQQKSGREPVEVERIDRETAANFGLRSTQGLPSLRAVSNAYAAELRAVDDEQKAHANARAKLELSPVRAQMQAFEARRQRIVTRGGPFRSSNTIVSAGR